MKHIQQRVAQRPDLGKQQFNRISRPLPRCVQCSLAEPFGERLAGAFSGGFDLGQFSWSQARSYRFGAKAGPSLISKRCLAPSRKGKFGSTHGKSLFMFLANARQSRCYDKFSEPLTGQCVYANCSQQCFSVYERKRQGRAELHRETKPFSQNKFTFVNISALASAPQFPNWG